MTILNYCHDVGVHKRATKCFLKRVSFIVTFLSNKWLINWLIISSIIHCTSTVSCPVPSQTGKQRGISSLVSLSDRSSIHAYVRTKLVNRIFWKWTVPIGKVVHGARAWNDQCRGQEVKGQGHMRPKIDLWQNVAAKSLRVHVRRVLIRLNLLQVTEVRYNKKLYCRREVATATATTLCSDKNSHFCFLA